MSFIKRTCPTTGINLVAPLVATLAPVIIALLAAGDNLLLALAKLTGLLAPIL